MILWPNLIHGWIERCLKEQINVCGAVSALYVSGLLVVQVFFHAEADARKQLGQDTQLEQDNSFITGTHLFLWLPHFHDFCLTVGILGCGMKGHPLVLMSPLHFMNNPTLWMDCMSRYKTTHTVGPDFSFAHVTK